ncbi:two-component system response regulator [Bosea sp. Leaf344]|jgi:two-component system, NarL family, nitrate/nitrite response regulator NarL|uniref:response regulator n=1 Tax=Bosea sp. Leaf344 TaxID=1736346 RepID=UPI0006F3201E|nr:response regulator transcription factor [Bosea sp. Leaf344]KQU51141.1 two-component system response regulator [Bosea sp. Leaf344]
MDDCAIAIVDDHPLMAEGIASILNRRGGFRLVATGKVAEDVYDIAERHRPDVLVVDLNMPGDIFVSTSRALAASPEMKIVVFTASTSAEHAVKALNAGASAYVLKGSASEELFDAIAAALRGEVHITPVFAAKVIGALQSKALEKRAAEKIRLSAREDQIVRLLLCGKQNREIARTLSLSEKTVKSYMTNLMQKLNVRNRLEVVIAAQKISARTGPDWPN